MEYHVIGVGGWDHFDSLVDFLKKYYEAEVKYLKDAIFIRKAIFLVGGEEITLIHHDDIGNYFFSSVKENSTVCEKVSQDLEVRLMGSEYQ